MNRDSHSDDVESQLRNASIREERARQSLGTSGRAIYQMVVDAIVSKSMKGALVDVGCGTASLRRFLPASIKTYVGVDIIRHADLDDDVELVEADLDGGRIPLESDSVDIVISAETIEHVENPRSFIRELLRLVRPGGWVLVTTPNQLSLLSKLTLLFKNQFNAFQASDYPAHITALLEIDLLRIATELSLADIEVQYSNTGRIPGTSWYWPRFMGGRWFSDNLMLLASKSVDGDR